MPQPAMLVLEDGSTFRGTAHGAEGEAYGEIVFNTAMVGYQEILTDPSYKGQMVVMTYPLIGNYGVNREDLESAKTYLEGFIVREFSRIPSNFRSKATLDDFLKDHGVIGIEGIDTRQLTRTVRVKGAPRAVISTIDLDPKSLLEKVLRSPTTLGIDLVKDVTCDKTYTWDKSYETQWTFTLKNTGRRHRIVAYDFGIKQNILRSMVQSGFDVTIVPASTPAEKVLDMKPAGVFLSNGPGDPEPVAYAIENIRKLTGKVPIFGICLGHQLTALAFGARTYKMKFGHHGGNQPVMDLTTEKVEITSQNHSFAVDEKELTDLGLKVTHVNLNDRTVEGMQHTHLPIFTVQYHPEASPGPHDSIYLFDRFRQMIERN